jgi:anti-sigma factor RsiW
VNTDHEELRLLLGGYLIGGLDDADQERVDAHLPDCAACRDESARLAPVAELLRRLPATDPVPPPASDAPSAAPSPLTRSVLAVVPSQERIDGLLCRMRAERARDRRGNRVRWLAVAAAVVAVFAVMLGLLLPGTWSDRPGGTALPHPTTSGPVTVQPSVTAEPVTARFVAVDAGGPKGEAVLTPHTWGVSVALDVSGLPGDGPFMMQVCSHSGTTEQAAIWGRTPSGRARVTGASSLQLRTVRYVRLADHQGRILATAELTG